MLFREAVGNDKYLLGGKGYGLVEMTSIGLPVPPGFVVTTEACKQYYSEGGKIPAGLFEEVRKKVKAIETQTEKKLGDTKFSTSV
jgi:pyruvate,orthophosphate dikinase